MTNLPSLVYVAVEKSYTDSVDSAGDDCHGVWLDPDDAKAYFLQMVRDDYEDDSLTLDWQQTPGGDWFTQFDGPDDPDNWCTPQAEYGIVIRPFESPKAAE